MRSSRGMGCINPSKMPTKKVIHRKDDPNEVDMYSKGGKIKKFSGDDEESLVQMAKKRLSGSEYQEFRPSDEEVATGKMRNRAMNLDSMKDEVRAMPSYVSLGKDHVGAGARLMGTKKLDKDSMIQAYMDADVGKSRGDKVRASVPGFGVSYVRQFADGGDIWDKPRPKSLGKPKKLSPQQKSKAKASAKAAGRPYPNLVDNIKAKRKK